MTTYCNTIQVVSGDSCSSLASRCGITPTQFTNYNPSANLCSTLTPGEHVCCSPGTMPDYTPKKNADGSCYSRLVQSGDTCSDIAANYSITVTQIENRNNNTWGWLGCADLQAGQNVCLSLGTPPFPAPIPNAVCGPQVPNTTAITNTTAWPLLNLCPLNACCDIWGQCGTYPEFCTVTVSTTGNPGTAAAGTNGCISNCGTDIVQSAAPAEFRSVGYFEAFNLNRPCLNLNAFSVDSSKYTHLHYAFGNITSTFDVNDGGYGDQFRQFLNINDAKRIMSFGGWAFSTDPSTYMIFRQGTLPVNAPTLAQNVANFIISNNLDGVDFDWEYPSEPDIPGIPAGGPDQGAHYLAFLQQLRTLLPSNTTISVAAPASYWYLKGFPIAKIAQTVDYIVYMTYDLHGIWDQGNSYSQDGCPGGNCLRSDVNLTETTYALSMITKAGVPSNQVVVGVTSYGRTFTMSDGTCHDSQCTYTGPGLAGECTGTAGYLANAEINQILGTSEVVLSKLQPGDDTDVLVYNGTQWVGYMSAATKANRVGIYQGYNMGGTSDWAVDLQTFVTPPGELFQEYTHFSRNVDCNLMCQPPISSWNQSMVQDFAWCGATYIDGVKVNGSLHSFATWTSSLTENTMQCDHFPNVGTVNCELPDSTVYCGNSSIPAGKYQALWMAANLYLELKTMKEAVLYATVQAQNSIVEIVNDFPVPTYSTPLSSTVLGSIGGAISTVGGFLGEDGLPFTAAGYIVSLTGLAQTPASTGANLQEVLGNYTSDFLADTTHAIDAAAVAIWQTGTLDNAPPELTNDVAGNGFNVSMANFFYNVAPVLQFETTQNNALQDKLVADLERGLVGAALRAGNYYLVKNYTDAADCNATTGNLPYQSNGLCYTLQAPGLSCQYGPGKQGANLPLSQVQLLTGKYNVSWTDLIQSAEGCQNGDATPVGNMPFSYEQLTWSSDQHSPCFYHFGVLDINYLFYSQDACQIWEVNSTAPAGTTPVLGSTYLPDYLNDIFTSPFCTCPTGCKAKRSWLTGRTVCG